MLILQPLLSAPLSSCNQKEESELLCILIDMYSKCEKLCLVIVLLLPQLLSVRIMYQTSFGFGFFFGFLVSFVCQCKRAMFLCLPVLRTSLLRAVLPLSRWHHRLLQRMGTNYTVINIFTSLTLLKARPAHKSATHTRVHWSTVYFAGEPWPALDFLPPLVPCGWYRDGAGNTGEENSGIFS